VIPAASTLAVLALGSNLGDRGDTLVSAVAELADGDAVTLRRISPVVQTEAVGGPADQPDFLNMVIEVETVLGPLELLRRCQLVEQNHHRVRDVRWGPRTLDIDVITYGDQSIDSEELTVPHPRAASRAFVLQPWSEMDPGAVLGGVPVAELALRAPDLGGLRPYRPEGDG
jgi:2-amino-4-hydroxy-6-hydroxymethyldihydropteridine diphosphokinase